MIRDVKTTYGLTTQRNGKYGMVIIALTSHNRNCMKICIQEGKKGSNLISEKNLLIDRDIFRILVGECLNEKE